MGVCVTGGLLYSPQELPVRVKLFVQSVKCPVCNHANDFVFRYCQRCGYVRNVAQVRPSKDCSVDVDEIDKRLQQLNTYD